MGEETSLARQLRKLAVPQTALLLQDKIRPSLLFDPKEASSLDRDTVFAYGCNGLDKLILINAKFSKFESSLFSQSIVTFERSVQTEAANKNLDEWISEFLTMLSPYFLLRDAHEALEWLIYRFRVHMFNIDSLIACVLPHYHTRIFVRVLQLIDLSDESFRWHWLQPTKKSGKPLELSIILKQINCNRWFCKFVCNLASEIVKVYDSETDTCNIVLSFSTVTIYYDIKLNNNINDSLVTLLFPFIVKGLKLQIPSYCGGVYAIIGILMVKLKFTEDLLKDLLVTICANFESSLLKEGFELMAVIFQHQDIKKIPSGVFDLLVNEENALTMMKHLSDNYSCKKFITSLTKKSIPAALKDELRNLGNEGKKLNFALNLLNNICLEDANIKTCFNVIFKNYIKLYEIHKKDTNMNRLQQAGKMMLKCLENRWPTIFDNAIECFFQENSVKTYKCALNLVNASVNDPRHEVLPTYGLTLFLGLNHANAVVREHSVKSLLKQVMNGKITDVQFIIKALVERMTDENTNVALAVLEEEEVLFTVIPKETLFDTLKSLLKMQSKPSKEVQLAALKLLCVHPYNTSDDHFLTLWMFEVLLPFLFPIAVEDMDNFLYIKNSTSTNPFITCLKDISVDECNGHGDLISLNRKVLKTLLAASSNMTEDFSKSLISHFVKNLDIDSSESMACIFAVLLSGQIEIPSAEKKCDYFIDAFLFLRSLACSKRIHIDDYNILVTDDVILERCMRSLQKNRIPLSVICFGFKVLLEKLQSVSELPLNHWWPDIGKSDLCGQYFRLLLDLFSFFITESNCITSKNSNKRGGSFKLLLAFFIKEAFGDIKHILWFLSFLWSSHSYVKLNNLLQVSALQIATVLCEKSVEKEIVLDFFFESTSKLFPTLLVPLYAEAEEVRMAALDFLHQLQSCTQSQCDPFRILGKEICHHSEEIKSDRNHLIQVFDVWLLPIYKLFSPESGERIGDVPSDAGESLEVYNSLLSLTLDKKTPCYIRRVLLMVFQKADVRTLMDDFLVLLDFYLEKDFSLDDGLRYILKLLINKYTVDSVTALTEDSKFLKLYLSLFQSSIRGDNESDTTILQLALSTLTKEFFFAIPSTIVQQQLMDTLVDLYINLRATDTHSKVGKILKKLCSSAYLLLKELPDVKTSDKSGSLREAKKSRLQNDNSPSAVVLTHGAWKKITIILEIVQNKKNLNNQELLVPELFRLLNYSLDWENQSSVDYVRQLILSSIYNCCKEVDPDKLDEHKFQIELVIQCIRTSDNPKTHHQALLLLNLAATMFPDHVLRNVMSIFTFMGKNLIRQDDSYSFQIISQTIETIVPSLLQASKQRQAIQQSMPGDDEHIDKKPKTVQVIATIIRKFVNSLPDIPRHRQLPLFMKLISTLESSDYLWVPIAQICERYASPSKFYQIYVDYGMYKDLDPTLEFAVNFHQQFSLGVQLDTCLHLINHLSELPIKLSKKNSPKKTVSIPDEFQEQIEPFDLPNCTNEKLQHYRQNLLCYLNLWLSSQSFINLVAELDLSALYSLEPQYKALHESTLRYMQSVNDISLANPNLQLIFKFLHDLLNNINSHLPCRLFIDVITSLLHCTISTVQQNALQMLNYKLERSLKFFTQVESDKPLLKLLKKLVTIVKKSVNVPENNSSTESVLLSRTAFTSIYLICRLLGSQYQTKFYKVLNVVSSVFNMGKKCPSLLVPALLCFNELCSCLNALMLPSLNSFTPLLINMMNDCLVESSDSVLLALIKGIHGLIKNLGSFLSSYMDSIITNVCILSAKYRTSSKKDLQDILDEICILISKEIAPRILIASIHRSYNEVVDQHYEALSPMVNILAKKISETSPIELEDFSIQLQNFYIEILAFRSNYSGKARSLVESVEKDIIDSLMVYVLKLSESTFALFFNQIYAWATPPEFKEDSKNTARTLTFYKLTCTFSKALKSIFVVFANKFIRHAASVMDANNSSKGVVTYFDNEEDSVCILNYIFDTLTFCFKYNKKQLGEKEFFDVAMQPLVDQLENELGGDKIYQERIESRLAGCIAHFTMLFSETALWKSLNYQVLLKTRHSSAKVRFATLQAIREIVRQMNTNYLALLPESIPFLAEIMEDESFEVEQECQDVIADMEKILGESIKTYF